MKPIKIFINDNDNNIFYTEGFVKTGMINNDTVNELLNISDNLNIPDYLNCDYNCGMNSDQYELRKKMQDSIVKLIQPYFVDILDDFLPYSATFVNKNPNDNCFVHAHQDFTYTREPEVPAVMCWIPLVDVDLSNSAMGFIPKSQRFFNHIRAFPFPFAKSAITEYEIDLMAYFKIINMKAGEMVFFMNNTIHGSFGNYTDKCRYAIAVNFYKNGEKIYAYIHNPETNGNTIFKYEVNDNFIVENNNVFIHQQYQKGKMVVNVHPTGESKYEIDQDLSWRNLANKLEAFNISLNSDYKKMVDNYKKFQQHEKIKQNIKDKIYNIYRKIV